MIERSIRQFGIRRRYGVVGAAVHRRGVNVREGYQDLPLAFGDTLMVKGLDRTSPVSSFNGATRPQQAGCC